MRKLLTLTGVVALATLVHPQDAATTVGLRAGWNPVALQAPQVASLTSPPQALAMATYEGASGYVVRPLSVQSLNEGNGGTRAFMVFANGAADLVYQGTGTPPRQVSLKTGYNLISTAQTEPVPGSALRASVGGTSVPLASAVLPTFFRLEPDGTTTPVDVTAGGTLEAGRAYWAFASQEARLTWGSAPRVTSLMPLSGPSAGGTAVTLTGTGFTGTTAVSFGSQPANSFTVSSDTQIVATAPGGTGQVDITVRGPQGTSTSGPRYTYSNAPTLTSLTPNSGWLGGSSGITLTGSGFRGATEVRFGAAPVLFTVLSDTEIRCDAPSSLLAGGPSVQVIVTGPSGSSLTSDGSLFTYYNATFPTNQPPTGNAFGPTKLFAVQGGGTAVYRINSAGNLASFATLLAATNSGPRGFSDTDAAGNLYVPTVSGLNKITPGGSVSLLSLGGTVLSGCAVDSANNIYCTTLSGGTRIMKVDPGGTATLFATLASTAHGIRVDGADNVYIGRGNVIQAFTPAGAALGTFGTAGTYLVDAGADARGLARDSSGDFYFASFGQGRVYKVNAAGTTTTLYSNVTSIEGVEVDAAGIVYVTVIGNTVSTIPVGGGTATTFATAPANVAGMAVPK